MSAKKSADNLPHSERMKKHQPARVPILVQPPFLQEPANFGSARTRDQVEQSQAGQIIPIPPPKRSPSVLDLAEVVGQEYVDEISVT
jgi:hypothetical protein